MEQLIPICRGGGGGGGRRRVHFASPDDPPMYYVQLEIGKIFHYWPWILITFVKALLLRVTHSWLINTNLTYTNPQYANKTRIRWARLVVN